MTIPIEEDLEELLSYSLSCGNTICRNCPLHLENTESNSKSRCLWIAMYHIIGCNKIRKNIKLEPEEVAMWIRIIADKHMRISCSANIKNKKYCKACKLTKIKSSNYICGVFKFHEFIKREMQ